MTPYHSDPWLTVWQGDCREVMAQMEPESVHCVVTSPPYWGLRDYGTATWLGGDEEHVHEGSVMRTAPPGTEKQASNKGASSVRSGPCRCGAVRQDSQLGLEPTPEEYVANMVAVFREVRRVLRADGTCWVNLGDSYNNRSVARKSSHQGGLGFESEDLSKSWASLTQEGRTRLSLNGGAYSLKEKDLVGIPWRVAFALQADGWYLRSDIIWAKPNPMPESVTDRPTKAHEYLFLLAKGQWVTRVVQAADLDRQRFHLFNHIRSKGAPVGDAARLVGILAEGVFQASEGQEDIGLPPLDAQVWSERDDSGDRDPVGRLPVEHRAAGWAARFLTANCSAKEFLGELNRLWVALPERDDLLERWCASEVALSPSVLGDGEAAVTIHDAGKVGEFKFGRSHTLSIRRPTGAAYYYDADAVREPTEWSAKMPDGWATHEGGHGSFHREGREKGANNGASGSGRNLRSVWTIATQPYPGAHFATFPEALVEPCVKAGTSERGVCPECGAPWRRVVSERPYPAELANAQKAHGGIGNNLGGQRHQDWLDANPKTTTGWDIPCKHIANVHRGAVPATVLDPFAGSGTTGRVAQRLGRRAVLIDLNGEYLTQTMKRNADIPLGLEAG